MTEYKTLGVTNPNIKLQAVFYEKGELQRLPIVALIVVECSDIEEDTKSILVEPLCFSQEQGDIWPAQEVGSYLGMEAEGVKKDWKEDIERLEK